MIIAITIQYMVKTMRHDRSEEETQPLLLLSIQDSDTAIEIPLDPVKQLLFIRAINDGSMDGIILGYLPLKMLCTMRLVSSELKKIVDEQLNLTDEKIEKRRAQYVLNMIIKNLGWLKNPITIRSRFRIATLPALNTVPTNTEQQKNALLQQINSAHYECYFPILISMLSLLSVLASSYAILGTVPQDTFLIGNATGISCNQVTLANTSCSGFGGRGSRCMSMVETARTMVTLWAQDNQYPSTDMMALLQFCIHNNSFCKNTFTAVDSYNNPTFSDKLNLMISCENNSTWVIAICVLMVAVVASIVSAALVTYMKKPNAGTIKKALTNFFKYTTKPDIKSSSASLVHTP